MPFFEVEADFTAAEGEGDRSLAYWQRAGAEFSGANASASAVSLSAPVVCERFTVVYRGAGVNGG